MINIEDKTKCCGCNACANICPVSCISLNEDEEGFYYPFVDKEKCISCGQCDKVCHYNFELKNMNNSKSYYAAYSSNLEIVKDSSSGGVFWEIVKYVFSENGVIYGAILESDFYVRHTRTDTLNTSAKIRKSKYLQSNIEYTYREAKDDLSLGKLVLFSGTPCQIAGLKAYLQKEYENLVTVDVVCHGVPSRKLFSSFIKELNHEYNDQAVEMIWRDKRNGWGPNHISIKFSSGKEVVTTSQQNKYQKGFLDNFYLRPSCYSCKYAKLPRIGDISLADFWGYEGALKESNNNVGMSLVIVSSNKGADIFERIKENLIFENVEESYAKEKSRHSHMPPRTNRYRKMFFNDYRKGLSFDELYKKYIIPPLPKKIYNRLKSKIIK